MIIRNPRITAGAHGLLYRYDNSASANDPRQASAFPAAGASQSRPGDLPEPDERRRLREQWGLSTRQVATAFGVTPATVRSWEQGRSAPQGGRKEAYRRFLGRSGAAEGTGAGEVEDADLIRDRELPQAGREIGDMGGAADVVREQAPGC
ncbi:helix-turn-helix domain-containing protein [Streptomyces gardneri]|uniref:helix-turn-helix domain-containing protein n=1 Tax=Streptomyces gardneri TaxID=66892 RepID=UPI0035D64B74